MARNDTKLSLRAPKFKEAGASVLKVKPPAKSARKDRSGVKKNGKNVSGTKSK